MKKREHTWQGAFLGGGSVSRPQSDYHLEMVTQSQKFAGEIVKAMKAFRMNAKLTDRKNDYIVYIKDGDEVSGFLQIVGAAQSYMDFEGVRVVKDMRNRVNRQVNCETANLQKTVDAAVRQSHLAQTLMDKVGSLLFRRSSAKPANCGSLIRMPAFPSWLSSAASRSQAWHIVSRRWKRWLRSLAE